MKIAFAILTTLLLLASRATAQPARSGPPPIFQIVDGTDQAAGFIRLTEMRPVQEQYTEKRVRVIEGVPIEEEVVKTKTVYAHITGPYNAAKSQFITPDGKQVPVNEVWKRLKAKSVVAVSADGKVPDEAYLQALNRNTLVIILPQADPVREPVEAPPVKKKLPAEKK